MADKRLDQENVLTDFDYALIVKGTDVAKISKADLAKVVGGLLGCKIEKTSKSVSTSSPAYITLSAPCRVEAYYSYEKSCFVGVFVNGQLHTIHNSLSTPQVSLDGNSLKVTVSYGSVYMNFCLTYL